MLPVYEHGNQGEGKRCEGERMMSNGHQTKFDYWWIDDCASWNFPMVSLLFSANPNYKKQGWYQFFK